MQVHVNGVIDGLALALLALGFQLVYLPTRILFVALAGLYSLAPYVYLAARSVVSNDVWCLAAAIGTTTLLALGLEFANHAPLSRRRAGSGAHLVSSLGLYIVIVQAIALIWGQNVRNLRVGLDPTMAFAGTVLTQSQVLIGAVSCALTIGILALLFATGFGLRLRALASNPSAFALFGHDARPYRQAAFAMSGGFAAVVALLNARDVGFAPGSGLPAILLAVVAVIVGGRGSFAGPVAAGVLLGVLRAEVVWRLSARWQDVVTFGILALFLLACPRGLAGRPLRAEAVTP